MFCILQLIYKENRTDGVFQNRTETKPKLRFLSKPNQNLTELEKSIPHISTYQIHWSTNASEINNKETFNDKNTFNDKITIVCRLGDGRELYIVQKQQKRCQWQTKSATAQH